MGCFFLIGQNKVTCHHSCRSEGTGALMTFRSGGQRSQEPWWPAGQRSQEPWWPLGLEVRGHHHMQNAVSPACRILQHQTLNNNTITEHVRMLSTKQQGWTGSQIKTRQGDQNGCSHETLRARLPDRTHHSPPNHPVRVRRQAAAGVLQTKIRWSGLDTQPGDQVTASDQVRLRHSTRWPGHR